MARASDFDDKKYEVLSRIADATSRRVQAPTVRELADLIGVAPATMHSWLGKLSGEGLVEWETGRHRSLRCTRKGSRLLSSRAKQSA